MIDIAIDTESCWEQGIDWEGRFTEAVKTVFDASGFGFWDSLPNSVEIAIRLTDDIEMKALNSEWRGKDKATNVLSFPQLARTEIINAKASYPSEILFGDIVLAYETCCHEAQQKCVSIESHATHLVVHGTLHLLGYDHQADDEALEMERLESAIMASLGFVDPYAIQGEV